MGSGRLLAAMVEDLAPVAQAKVAGKVSATSRVGVLQWQRQRQKAPGLRLGAGTAGLQVKPGRPWGAKD